MQRELREIEGLTVLIYDQTCAAEKRRRRKRGLYPDPPKRAFINDLVCEGCGDCSAASNCVSVQPLETEFGRKRQIDQSNCNKDFSCVEGFCPSFVTVHGGRPKQAVKPAFAVDDLFGNLPVPPARPLEQPYNILIAGIGGTGVITIGALLGMAAHLEGKGCSALDFTGLAQKNGAVMSHVRIAAQPEDIAAVRVAAGGADLLLGCDIVVSASPAGLSRADYMKTRAIINADLQPTASFVINPDIDFEIGAMQRAHSRRGRRRPSRYRRRHRNRDRAAWRQHRHQRVHARLRLPEGADPAVARGDLQSHRAQRRRRRDEHAGVLLGTAGGRGHARACARRRASGRSPNARPRRSTKRSLTASAFLTEYQNSAYAARYLQLVAAVRKAESAALPGSAELTEAVAKNLFKLMAYKDEYEVARLYADGAFAEKLRQRFDGDFRLSFHLAPPLLARRDPLTGHLQKREYGAWMMPAFRLLARLKFLRGTAFDPFGYTSDRKAERRLIADYETAITRYIAGLRADRIAALARLARLPEMIRGYGHIKEDAIRTFTAERSRAEADIENGSFAVAAE